MSFWSKNLIHRAPAADFPPPWASAWGDDKFGLWADLKIDGEVIAATQRMRWIEPCLDGFQVGSSQKERESIELVEVRDWAFAVEEEIRLEVIPNGFWLADTPCTQSFWLAVMGYYNFGYTKTNSSWSSLPVDQIPLRGETLTQSVHAFFKKIDRYLFGALSSVPSEFEWEYACRAGAVTRYWWGDDFNFKLANTNSTNERLKNNVNRSTPVGNVWEWCKDPWRRPSVDITKLGSSFVVKGGSWVYHPAFARSAYRGVRLASNRSRGQGFRFAIYSSGSAR
jgi:formylglycine-generating enzyme required for sulfatase activity